MKTSDRTYSFSRKEARLAVDRAMGLSLLACVSGLLVGCRKLHRLGGWLFLGCVGVHLAQHKEWLWPEGPTVRGGKE